MGYLASWSSGDEPKLTALFPGTGTGEREMAGRLEPPPDGSRILQLLLQRWFVCRLSKGL